MSADRITRQVLGSIEASFVGLRTWWNRRRHTVLVLATVTMAIAAALWLGYEFFRLLAQPVQIGGRSILVGAIDLAQRHCETHRWFAGQPVYLPEFVATYPPATYLVLFVLLLLGVWVRRHRDADLWLLMGVSGLFTRLWTYHGWYDDLVILPAMVALYRMARAGQGRLLAGTLLAASLAVMIAPGGQYLLPRPWNGLFMALQVAVWLSVMVYLIALAPAAQADDRVLRPT